MSGINSKLSHFPVEYTECLYLQVLLMFTLRFCWHNEYTHELHMPFLSKYPDFPWNFLCFPFLFYRISKTDSWKPLFYTLKNKKGGKYPRWILDTWMTMWNRILSTVLDAEVYMQSNYGWYKYIELFSVLVVNQF